MSFPETTLQLSEGRPWPLGATPTTGGVQFALFSRHAEGVSVLLFENAEDEEPSREFKLDPARNRTGDVWHCEIEGLGFTALYLYRVHGPYDPVNGQRFNSNLGLIDPYAQALTDCRKIGSSLGYDSESNRRDLLASTSSNLSFMPKCIVVDPHFDWEGDRPLNHPSDRAVIYEAHVKGMTAHRSARVEHHGTYRGVIEHIPYLKELGITSLELLPLHEFNEDENPRVNPRTGRKLSNYWGYSTIAFFAPKGSYASDRTPGAQVREFKEMVRELHKAGIEVILDVVFNHTGEGGEMGPTFSFRGIDNRSYYILDSDPRYYKNFSGCGNTVNCNHPAVRSFILDCLRYWVIDMHVDGFRFDLGSILARDQNGELMENPPMLERIAEDPVLRDTKIIAEAWDAGGAYQVGSFPGGRWAEWNDRFRDDVRKFWRGEAWMLGSFATRLAGSSDLYAADGRKPFHSVNFVTCHDGFTLNDLVTYSRKHNYENGEAGRDGHGANFSYNYGVEGPSKLQTVRAVRARQVRNFLVTLLVSQGIPMFFAGDEIRHTQRGNNNAYCQDNEITWLNYELDEEQASLKDFTRDLIRFRLSHPALLREDFFTGIDRSGNARSDIAWLDCRGEQMRWQYAEGCIGMVMDGSDLPDPDAEPDDDILVFFNATTVEHEIALPQARKGWRVVTDTSAGTASRVHAAGEEPLHDKECYVLAGRSSVILLDPHG